MQGPVVEGLSQTATSGSQCFFLSETLRNKEIKKYVFETVNTEFADVTSFTAYQSSMMAMTKLTFNKFCLHVHLNLCTRIK